MADIVVTTTPPAEQPTRPAELVCDKPHVTIRRRALCGAATTVVAAAVLAPALPVLAGITQTGDDAALLALDRAAERFHSFEGLDDLDEDDPAFDEFASSWVETVGQLSTTPAHTLSGIAAKVKWCLRDKWQGESEHAWEMAQGLLADLARLTGQPVPKVDAWVGEAAHA